MKNLEIIHLRLAGESPENLEKMIRKCIGTGFERMEIRIYRDVRLGSDLAVHLIRETDDKEGVSSDVGIKLAALLKNYGMVSHSVWGECCGLVVDRRPEEAV